MCDSCRWKQKTKKISAYRILVVYTSQRYMKLNNTTITTTNVSDLRTHEKRKRKTLLDAATLLYKNLRYTWNSVMRRSLYLGIFASRHENKKQKTLEAAISFYSHLKRIWILVPHYQWYNPQTLYARMCNLRSWTPTKKITRCIKFIISNRKNPWNS